MDKRTVEAAAYTIGVPLVTFVSAWALLYFGSPLIGDEMTQEGSALGAFIATLIATAAYPKVCQAAHID